ncbi:MAG: carboxylate--amine ligase, partial [bacterium]|nr:carboxylate--amine ligase [bacterium]
NAVDNPGPGIGIARALKEDKDLNVRIVGLAYDAMEPGIYMDWLIDKTYILPYPSSPKEALFQRLAYIKSTYGLDFIFPNLDSELPFYTQYRQELEDMGIHLFVPGYEQLRLRDKARLPEVARTIGIDIPRTIVVNSYKEMVDGLNRMSMPVMVKGALYKAHKAETHEQAKEHFFKISAEWGFPIILQEVVAGDEMNVISVGDGLGESMGRMGIKKMWITELGKIWTGVSVKHEKMLAAAESFVEKYLWKGPFEMECIVNGDKVWLIEINPRFPAWSYFSTGVGLNLPANTVRKAFKLPLNIANDYEAGKLYIRYTYETVQDLDVFQKISIQGEN